MLRLSVPHPPASTFDKLETNTIVLININSYGTNKKRTRKRSFYYLKLTNNKFTASLTLLLKKGSGKQ